MSQIHTDDDDLVVQETDVKLELPPLYQVVLLNDDYTPMDFVVHVLELFFNLSREMATHVMLQVHLKGKGICGTYPREIAETKVAQVNHYARENQHPLLCTMEKV